jgi:hypothetical protein
MKKQGYNDMQGTFMGALIKVPGYPQADSVIKHAWKEIFAGIKHLWGGMNVAVSNF